MKTISENKTETFFLPEYTTTCIEPLSVEQRGQMLTAILEYVKYGTIPNFENDTLLQTLTNVVLRGLKWGEAGDRHDG